MVERQPYELIRDLGDNVELRHYPSHRVVSVDVQGGFDHAGNLGFGPLVGYISGANDAGQKIAMTSPVVLEPTDEGSQTVSFVLPQKWWDQDLPEPTARGVRVESRPESTIAARRFRGLWREARVREQENILLDVLAREAITPAGAVFYARYDPPSVPGLFRRNEVLVPVRGTWAR